MRNFERSSVQTTNCHLLGTYDDGLEFIAAGGLQSHHIPETIHITAKEPYRLDRVSRDPSPDSGSSRSSSNDTSMTAPSTPDSAQPPLHIMFLGSSLGNFTREDGSAFLRSLPLRHGYGDTLLLGLDHDNEAAKIELAYDDPKGYTRKFIMNGLKAAGSTLGDENMFDEDKWEYVGKYNEQEREFRREIFIYSLFIYQMGLQVAMRPITSRRITKASSTRRRKKRSHSSQMR